MDVKKIGFQIPPSIAEDDGEAISRSGQKENIEPHDELQMPDDAGWYVAVVRCNCEKTIAEAINEYFRGEKIWFEYWIPMYEVAYIDKRSNKRKFKEKVLLTTFIFCHVGSNHINDIRFRTDVYKMLTMPGQNEIYRLRDKELNDYRRIIDNPDLPITPCSGPLRKGQKVRITEGKMAGLEAYVQRISGKKAIIGNEIKYISGATIEIDRSFLKVVSKE